MTRRIETVEWGVETDDLGSTDTFETETEARAALTGGGALVRITTTVEHDPSTPADARKDRPSMTRIETTEALDALTPGSVVLDATGLAWQMRHPGEWYSANFEGFGAWSDEIDAFPIRVLHDPSASVDAPTSGGDVDECTHSGVCDGHLTETPTPDTTDWRLADLAEVHRMLDDAGVPLYAQATSRLTTYLLGVAPGDIAATADRLTRVLRGDDHG